MDGVPLRDVDLGCSRLPGFLRPIKISYAVVTRVPAFGDRTTSHTLGGVPKVVPNLNPCAIPCGSSQVGTCLTEDIQWVSEPSELRHFCKAARIPHTRVTCHPVYLSQARGEGRSLLHKRRVTMEVLVPPEFDLAILVIIL